MSDDDMEFPLEPSDPETQFIPQEDDDETLWEVIEITAEKGKIYKVRWKGVDPATQKPWPQSWVMKHDCTDDLVRDWKLKQAKKRKKGSKQETGISKKSTAKASRSGLTSKATASPSKLGSADSTRRSISTTAAVTARRGRSKAATPGPSVYKKSTRSREPISPSPRHARSHSPVDVSSPTITSKSLPSHTAAATSVVPTNTGKRKHAETTSTATSARIPTRSTIGTEEDPRANNISGSVPPPRKKRKLEPYKPEGLIEAEVEREMRRRRKLEVSRMSKKSRNKGKQEDEVEEEQVELVNSHEHSTTSAQADDKGRKGRGRSRIASDDDDDDCIVEVKTESDGIVELGSEPSEPQNHNLTSLSQPEPEVEEAADERMIEESLSDMYCTPPGSSPKPSPHNQEEESTPVPSVRAQSPAHRRQDTVEESTPTVSRSQPEMERRMESSPPVDLAATTSKLDPLSKKSTRPSASSSSSATIIIPTVSDDAAESTKFSVLTQIATSKTITSANKRKKIIFPVTVSNQLREELNDFQSQQVTEPGMVSEHDKSERGISEEDPGLNSEGMDLDYPVVEEFPPPSPPVKLVVPDQASSSRAESAATSGPHSLTGGRTESPIPIPIPPSERSGSSGSSATLSTRIVIPTTPPRNQDGDANDEEDRPRWPILSSEDKKRLERFDRALMKIALKGGKGKEKEKRPEHGGKVKRGRKKKREERNDEEVVVAGGSGGQEHEVAEEKNGEGKANGQIKEDKEEGASTSKSPEAEPLFLPDESDFVDKPEVVTNTDQAKRLPSTTTVRRSANPRSNSFAVDVIPETEESQSQEIQTDPQQIPIATNLPVRPSTPSSVNRKFTAKSRMKPKTPQPKSRPSSRTSSAIGALVLGVRLDMDVGVGNDVDEDLEDGKTANKKANENGTTTTTTTTTKLFGHIPRISPSIFRSHLPSSSLPESIIESTEGDPKEEDDSIEQFESPVKGVGSGERRVGALDAAGRREREKPRVKESASDIWNSDLNHRGQELAEAARKREKERLRAEEESTLPASTLTKSMPRATDTPFGYPVTSGLDRLPDIEEEEINPDVSMQSLPPDDVILPPPEDSNSVVQQMEDAYGDLSGGVSISQTDAPAAVGTSTSANVGVEGSQSFEAELRVKSDAVDVDEEMGIVEQQLDPIYLRQEEEESTQDLMVELRLRQQQQQQGLGVEQSGDLVAAEVGDDNADLPPAIQVNSQPIIEAMLDEDVQKLDNEKSDRSVDEIPSIIVEKPSRAASARSYSPHEDGDGASRRKARSRTSKSRSRSRSPSRSLSSQKGENMEPDPEVEISATASIHRESVQALSQPSDSQTENVENPHHLGAAMHLLNTKSEEISKLEGQLSAAQRTNEDLLQQLSDLGCESTNDVQSATKTLEQELAEVRAQLALQTASWEDERANLVLNIETATRGKVSAEQDRDFFREQYVKASAFVSSVRDENAELEKQIKIATGQAQSGVSLIKSTFELRTKSLEEDVRAWRRMAEFLIEKDHRTNDDMRRRAAEEPELRARCDRQKRTLDETIDRHMELQADFLMKELRCSEAEEAGKKWKDETLKLNLELNEVKTKLERIGKVGIGGDGNDQSGHDPNGHEFVYRCQWRLDDSDDACEAVFLNISELQAHLYSGGHLQPD